MKRILLISREFPPGLCGSGIAVYNYIKNIKSYKFLVLSLMNPTFSNEYIEVKKLRNPFFGHRYPSAFLYIPSTILHSLGRYDLIVGNAFIGSACGVIVKKLIRKPLISIIYDVDYLYSPTCKYNRINKFIRKTMYNSIFSNSDIIVIPNLVIKKDIIKIFGKGAGEKVSVIALGVDVEPFEKIRKPEGKHVILFVGAIRRNKGIEYLIEAFKQVSDRFKNNELWIAGSVIERDYYSMLKELAKQFKIENKIKFLGPIKHFGKKNIFSYYDACDIFAIASIHSERFGIPCVEASSMGKPIVATDVFEENGVVVDKKTALVVAKKNSEELAKALIKLLKDRKLREKLGKGAKEYSERFKTSNLAKEFEAIIKRAIGSNSFS